MAAEALRAFTYGFGALLACVVAGTIVMSVAGSKRAVATRPTHSRILARC